MVFFLQNNRNTQFSSQCYAYREYLLYAYGCKYILFIYIYIYIHTRVDGSCNAQLFMNQCNLPVFFS